MEEFNCDWNSETYIVTILVFIVLICTTIFSFRKRKRKLLPIIFTSLLWLVPVIMLFQMPSKILLNANSIIIKGIAHNIVIIDLKDITTIEGYEQTDTTIRKFGSGGLFGNIGTFENKQLGTFQMYVTNKNNSVLIKTKTETYVINCENPDLFIQQIVYYCDINVRETTQKCQNVMSF